MAEENTNTPDPGSAEVAIDLGDATTNDDVISKHIDLAIEAQDGAQAKSGEADAEAEGDPAKAKAGTDSAGTGQDAVAQPKAKEGEASARGPRDLVLADGTVVKGGPERRFYEQMRSAKDQAALLSDQLRTSQEAQNKLRHELDTMRQSVQQVQGMEPQQLAIATRMYRDLQSDPVGTLKKLLAEATAKGYSIDGIGTGIDAAAIQQIIDDRLGATLTARQGPSEEQIVAEAQAEASQFFSRFPDARLHEPLIARIMHENPSVDLHTAYFGLRDNFATQGFDWSRSLDEQLIERDAAKAVNGSENKQQQQPATPPQPGMPSGRPAHIPATNTDGSGNSPVAHESTSKDDIIKQAMREAGITVN